jgi:hypothetical protein
MAECCPPGHGCNAPSGDEPCALTLCRAAATQEDDAALAVERWQALESSAEGDGERRFRRRAFERARDRALIGLALSARTAPIASAMKKVSERRRPARRRHLAHRSV